MGDTSHEPFVQIQKESGREPHWELSKGGKGVQNNLDKDEAAIFSSEVIAECMWTAMVSACDPRPSAVSTTLKHAFQLRSTKWWHNTKAIGMKNDSYNQTRWKHMWDGSIEGVFGTESLLNGRAKGTYKKKSAELQKTGEIGRELLWPAFRTTLANFYLARPTLANLVALTIVIIITIVWLHNDNYNPERFWAPKGGTPKGGAPKGGGPKFLAPSPQVSFSLSLSGVFSLNFVGV